MRQYDVLIIGSGLAGMSLALRLAETQRVALLTKHELLDAASAWAQGGIAAVLGDDDKPENHIRDTHIAGAGLCKDETVRMVVENGRRAVEWLVEQGVPFTRDDDNQAELHLTREGGHSHRRIVHAADATGRAVQKTLVQQLKSHPNIEVLEHHIAVDLITSKKLGVLDGNRCFGAHVLNNLTGKVETLGGRFTVLATGGTGKVYLYTSNPDVATGDGLAMGWRAGCRVANMEFIQFHPTCLYHPAAKSYLITEAVRGEGGHLKIPTTGERFMLQHDERAELAPRDIVARAIDFEMKKRGLDFVHLDISHKPADFLISHFPNIYQKCLSLGIDMTRDPIPVVPAAHYTCGGLVVDLDGRTDVEGLYAIGEVTCTGLHGANRLASNSLLECLVFSEAVEKHMRREPQRAVPPLPEWDESRVTNADEEVIISHNWDELRRFMWDYVGIVRTDKRLERAMHRIELLKGEIHEYYANFRVSNDLIELRNLVQTAELIVRCAMARKESRGLHFSSDFPDTAVIAKDTVLIP
ncbi:MAG: L-aspartate oxidase [Betaproteobacteria bacterium]|nr:L-aspartate oxidase [Betaproteobacteria bacterium]